eukprot:XP_001701364.1 predicted protein [Chlamydomonas reinhardtii]
MSTRMGTSTSKPRTTRTTLPKPAPLGEVPSLPEAEIVVRQDIRTMSQAMQVRVCEAIEKMMERGWSATAQSRIWAEGPWSVEAGDWAPSEYFRLARYHGWDRNYCAHGNETFPGWHRAYLLDFERTMQVRGRGLQV